MRVVVAGAGVLGAAAAMHLTRAGHDVVLIEQTQVAGATTGFAAGLLSLGVQDPVERRLVRATMQGLEATARRLEVDSPLKRPGSYVLARTRHETEHLQALARDLDLLDEPHERLLPHEWQKKMQERGLIADTQGISEVLSVPNDAWALSTQTTNLIVQAARQDGLKLRTNQQVTSLQWTGRKAVGVHLTSGERLDADHVVLALGAWTRPFLHQENLRLPALSFTTHAAVLSLDSPVDTPILHDHPGHYYFRPESDTHILVGNGTNTTPTDPDTFHPTPDPDFFSSVAGRITKRFPSLADARLQNAWRGILTATPDRAALAGAHPDAENLWVLTGDNGYGFMRAHALGQILCAKMDPDVQLDAAIPERALEQSEPARFWPDPPEHFPIHEGFELVDETPDAQA